MRTQTRALAGAVIAIAVVAGLGATLLLRDSNDDKPRNAVDDGSPVEIVYRNEVIPAQGAEPVDFGPFVVWPMFTAIPAQTLPTSESGVIAWIREPSDYPKSRLVVTPPAGWEAISFNGATNSGEPTTVLRVWQAADGRQVAVGLSELAEEDPEMVMASSERTRLALIEGNYAFMQTNTSDPDGVRGGVVTLVANGALIDVLGRGDPRPTLEEMAILAGQIARLIREE